MNADVDILKVPLIGASGFLTSLKLKLFIATMAADPVPFVVAYAPTAVALATLVYICSKVYFLFKNKGRSVD